jgi:hypothetical protein
VIEEPSLAAVQKILPRPLSETEGRVVPGLELERLGQGEA